MYASDGKETNISVNDSARRNTMAKLLKDWGLVEIIDEIGEQAPLSQIKVISFSAKSEWILEPKEEI